MDREKLKSIAGYYFHENMGAEPDSLTFIYANDQKKEYIIRAGFGSRSFEIILYPRRNQARLNEVRHIGTFEMAAELAGYDRNLKSIY